MTCIKCLKSQVEDTPSFAEFRRLFDGQPGLVLQQAWQSEPDAGFMPGQVWMGWEPDGFLVYAELEDRDIFNPVREFNAPAFLKGDVFEIFLKPEGSEAYYELHVGPHNQLFQYKIPSTQIFYELREEGLKKEWLLSVPVMESQVRLEPEKNRWRLFTKISMESLGMEVLKPGARWNFSFCRYDYDQGNPNPSHSSCSKLRKLDFHDQDCWDELVIV